MYLDPRNYDSSYDYYRDMANEIDRDERRESHIYEEMDRGMEADKWRPLQTTTRI
ncbi:hypothetical protein L2W58_08195 [Dethiosulfovibrio sp. F2B]|uniref:hypothetical protein n=1 Tax=Dethiosulfovibrio faecalis TaxID=2720018 RepID=UPI001F28CA71|nr:hypothetical protein [Dethiosulfovibrio faecalis]MCF4151782.1 hypothetical protein [Dethiosulfovibrio faecalis]